MGYTVYTKYTWYPRCDMIIVSGGEKGGTGKTMLATNLAVACASTGLDVLLADADGQGSSTRWATGRADLVEELSKASATNTPRRLPWVSLNGNTYYPLRDLEKRYALIIVDAGGADSEEFRTAIAAAVAVYSCIIPSDCDIGTLPRIDKAIRECRDIGNRDLLAKVVLNKCSTHIAATDVEEARQSLSDFQNLGTADSVIHYRDPFKNAYKARLTVLELLEAPDRKVRSGAQKAAEEMRALFNEIMKDLGLQK